MRQSIDTWANQRALGNDGIALPIDKPPVGHELLSMQKPRLANFIVSGGSTRHL